MFKRMFGLKKIWFQKKSFGFKIFNQKTFVPRTYVAWTYVSEEIVLIVCFSNLSLCNKLISLDLGLRLITKMGLDTTIHPPQTFRAPLGMIVGG